MITHAHEDHVGALAALWPRLDCTVLRRRFAAGLIEARRLAEPGAPNIGITLVKPGAKPRSSALSTSNSSPSPIRSRKPARSPSARRRASALHTGDWKIDATPGVGHRTDEARLRAARRRGRLGADLRFDQYIARRTRVLRKARWRPKLRAVIAEARGRVIVTTFASNVAARARDCGSGGKRRAQRRRSPAARWTARSRSRASSAISTASPPFYSLEHLRGAAARTQGHCSRREARARRARRMARASRGRSSRDQDRRWRSRHLLLAGHPRQSARGPAPHQQALRPRGGDRDRPRSPRALLRPSAAGRGRAALWMASGPGGGARAWRVASSRASCRLRARAWRRPGGFAARRRRRAACARRAGDHRQDRRRPPLQGWGGADRREATGPYASA